MIEIPKTVGNLKALISSIPNNSKITLVAKKGSITITTNNNKKDRYSLEFTNPEMVYGYDKDRKKYFAFKDHKDLTYGEVVNKSIRKNTVFSISEEDLKIISQDSYFRGAISKDFLDIINKIKLGSYSKFLEL